MVIENIEYKDNIWYIYELEIKTSNKVDILSNISIS